MLRRGRSMATTIFAGQRQRFSTAISDDFAEEAGYTRLARTLIEKQHHKWVPGQFLALYDAHCPLCSREIAHYEKLVAKQAISERQIRFQNLHDVAPGVLESHKLSKHDVMRRMTCITEDGSKVVGFTEFQEMWKRIPYWKGLAPLTYFPGVAFVGHKAYEYFAQRRWLARTRASPEARCSIDSKHEILNDYKNSSNG